MWCYHGMRQEHFGLPTMHHHVVVVAGCGVGGRKLGPQDCIQNVLYGRA